MNMSVRKYSKGVWGMFSRFLDSLWCVLGMFSTTVLVHYFTKILLDLHDFLSILLTFKIKASDS